MGTVDRSGPGEPTYTAERVIMRHLVPPEGLKFFAFRGRVVSVDAAGSKLVAHLHLVTRRCWQALETDFGFTVGPSTHRAVGRRRAGRDHPDRRAAGDTCGQRPHRPQRSCEPGLHHPLDEGLEGGADAVRRIGAPTAPHRQSR